MVIVSQDAPLARWALAKVKSGDVFGPFEGTLVGLSPFSSCISPSKQSSMILAPLAAALLSEVEENQAASWALKSPIIRVSSVEEKSGSRSDW